MNLTISVDDSLVKRARIRALEEGTSVNAVLNDFLRVYAGEHPAREAMKSLTRLAKKSTASSGTTGRTWTRDELYDR